MDKLLCEWSSEQAPKASSALCNLEDAPGEINSALLMCWQLKQLEIHGQLGVETLLPLQNAIAEAIKGGHKESQEVEASLKLLVKMPPVQSRQILLGL